MSGSRTFAAWVLLAVLGAAQSGSPQLPSGFRDEILASGFELPTGLAFLPDGRVVVIEQEGRLRVVVPGGDTAEIGVVPWTATDHHERGLFGIAVDPLWPAEPYLYVLYNQASPRSVRIARATVIGELNDPTSTGLLVGFPYLLLDDLPDQSPLHTGGCLRFGPDGLLYASVGDDAAPCSAQDPETLAGAVLRLDVSAVRGATGSGPPPRELLVPDVTAFQGRNARLVWAQGFRNPFRFAIDADTGDLWVGDVGAAGFEELDRVDAPALNFGWPWFEGPTPRLTCGPQPPALRGPAAGYDRTGVSPAAIVPFGGRYRHTPGTPHGFGPGYDGDVLYLDFYQGFVRRVRESGGTFAPAPPAPGQPAPGAWASGYQWVADALFGPDGALYYVHWMRGELRRILPEPGAHELLPASPLLLTGNPGQLLGTPLAVRLRDAWGRPLAGATVAFRVASGGGALEHPHVTTEADGTATTGYTLPESRPTGPIVIEASALAAAPLAFSVLWRGLEAMWDASLARLSVTVHHSAPDAPVTLVVLEPPAAPVATPFGSVVFDPLAPPQDIVALDGIGLFGPPAPAMRTPPGGTDLSLGFTLPSAPPTSIDLLLQAFAVDAGLVPHPAAVMVSQGVTVTVH